MKSKNVSAPERVIAAVLFSLVGLGYLAYSTAGATLWSLLLFSGFVFLAVTLFIRARDILPVIASGIVTLFFLLVFFRGFFVHAYQNYQYSYSSYFYSYDPEFRFNFLSLLPGLTRLAAWALFTLLALVNFLSKPTEGGSGVKFRFNRIWYLPALLLFASVLLAYLPLIGGAGRWVGSQQEIVYSVFSLILVPAFLFGAMWFTGKEPEGYFSIALHIALTVFTYGLWYVVWVWHVTRHLNKVDNVETRGPTSSLLLCLFLPFYAIYWTYSSAQRIDRLAKQSGVNSKLEVLTLVLSLVIPFLPSIIMQDKLNRITLVRNGVFTPDFAPEGAAHLPAVDESLPEL